MTSSTRSSRWQRIPSAYPTRSPSRRSLRQSEAMAVFPLPRRSSLHSRVRPTGTTLNCGSTVVLRCMMLLKFDTKHDEGLTYSPGRNPFGFTRSSCPNIDQNSKCIMILLVQLPVSRLSTYHKTVDRAPKTSICPDFSFACLHIPCQIDVAVGLASSQ